MRLLPHSTQGPYFTGSSWSRSGSLTRPTLLITQPSSADDSMIPFKPTNSSDTDDEARSPTIQKAPNSCPHRRRQRQRLLSRRWTHRTRRLQCALTRDLRRGTGDTHTHIRAHRHDRLRYCQAEGDGPACASPPPLTLPRTNIGGRTKASRHSSRPYCRSRPKDEVTDTAVYTLRTLSLEVLFTA